MLFARKTTSSTAVWIAVAAPSLPASQHTQPQHPWIQRCCHSLCCCCQPPAMFQHQLSQQHNVQHQHQQLFMQQRQQCPHPRPAASARVAPCRHAVRTAAVKADWREKGERASCCSTHSHTHPLPAPPHSSTQLSPMLHAAKPIQQGSTYPAQEFCSHCGLCDTYYVAHVKEACAFLGDGEWQGCVDGVVGAQDGGVG